MQVHSYSYPEGMQFATLEERKEFYSSEFNIERAMSWLQHPSKPCFAVIIGRHTKIYPLKYKDDAEDTIIIDVYSGPHEISEQILEFLPESVYYDRDVYLDDKVVGQELAFDLDPENVKCPIHGELAEKMKKHQGLSFCTLELNMVKEETLRLYEHLKKGFSKLKIVYSGRGFHIHVFDLDAYDLSVEARRKIALDVKNRGFPIDEWVTTGEMRLIRLPFSLNGLVSRIATPLEEGELESFYPFSDARCIPKFLRMKTTSL